jgi:hypothetical protein
MAIAPSNFEEETFMTKEARDKRWEELMLVKPHVVRGTTQEWTEVTIEGEPSVSDSCLVWWVRYPRLVL